MLSFDGERNKAPDENQLTVSLDFVPDCTRQAGLPRDRLGLIAEID
jgi:hypothetical protein